MFTHQLCARIRVGLPRAQLRLPHPRYKYRRVALAAFQEWAHPGSELLRVRGGEGKKHPNWLSGSELSFCADAIFIDAKRNPFSTRPKRLIIGITLTPRSSRCLGCCSETEISTVKDGPKTPSFRCFGKTHYSAGS